MNENELKEEKQVSEAVKVQAENTKEQAKQAQAAAVNEAKAASGAPRQVLPSKVKITGKQKGKIIRLFLIILAIIFITNPARIPFLPEAWKEWLVNAVSSVFKNITSISSVIKFSWVTLFQLILVILVLILIFEVLNVILNSVNPKSPRLMTLKNILVSVLKYLVVIFGVFWVLNVLGVDTGTLFAGLGIVALIIGFGAESLVADLVTGFFMIFENEYNIGDIIEAGGYRGTVTSIGIRTTCITDMGGNTKIINNSDLRNVINLSDQSSRAICDFPIPYETNIAEAEKKLEQILTRVQEEHPDVFAEKPEYIGVQELAESAVILRVVASVKEKDRFSAARILNRELKSGMEELGISCPFNQVVVHQAE